jgi:hypothetical protein
MPTLDLSPEEAARVEAGKCACGCGEDLPAARTDWNGNASIDHSRRTATTACRKRIARRRTKEGRAIPMIERARRADVDAAEQELRDAERFEQEAIRAHNAAARCRRNAARLFERANATRQIVLSFVTIDRLQATPTAAVFDSAPVVEVLPVRASKPAPPPAPVSRDSSDAGGEVSRGGHWTPDKWRDATAQPDDRAVQLVAGVHANPQIVGASGSTVHLWANVPATPAEREARAVSLRGLEFTSNGQRIDARAVGVVVASLELGPRSPKKVPRRFPPLSWFGDGARGAQLEPTDERLRVSLVFGPGEHPPVSCRALFR